MLPGSVCLLSSVLGQHTGLEESADGGLLLRMGRKWRELWTTAMVSLCWLYRLSFCLMAVAVVIRVPLSCHALPSMMNLSIQNWDKIHLSFSFFFLSGKCLAQQQLNREHELAMGPSL